MEEQRKYAIPFCRNNPGSAETQRHRKQFIQEKNAGIQRDTPDSRAIAASMGSRGTRA